MDAVITLVAPASGEIDRQLISSAMDTTGGTPTQIWLDRGIAIDLAFDVAGNDLTGLRRRMDAALAGYVCDFAIQPAAGRRKRLFLADMDATLIGQECIDELGIAAGVGERIAAITERAMRGDIDFSAAMAERVGLLKGLPETALAQVYENQITLNTGGETCVRTMAAHGVLTRLVSGGFTYFATRVAETLGFAHSSANELEIVNGHLTGGLVPPFFGRKSKLQALQASCAELGITPAEVLTVGDGANDLDMITAAGLGVAYRAKPILGEAADARINHADLTALLFFQGYTADQFIIG